MQLCVPKPRLCVLSPFLNPRVSEGPAANSHSTRVFISLPCCPLRASGRPGKLSGFGKGAVSSLTEKLRRLEHAPFSFQMYSQIFLWKSGLPCLLSMCSFSAAYPVHGRLRTADVDSILRRTSSGSTSRAGMSVCLLFSSFCCARNGLCGFLVFSHPLFPKPFCGIGLLRCPRTLPLSRPFIFPYSNTASLSFLPRGACTSVAFVHM